MQPFYIVLLLFSVLSILTLLLYGIDKWRAKRRLWRIRESTLLGLGFLGGAVGALLGMELFRHKTKHWYFWAANLFGLLWQAALAFYLVGRG